LDTAHQVLKIRGLGQVVVEACPHRTLAIIRLTIPGHRDEAGPVL